MSATIGNFKAKCPGCGKTTFKAAAATERKPNDKLTCESCGRVSLYKDLLRQMRKEAVKRKDKLVRDMVKGFNRSK